MASKNTDTAKVRKEVRRRTRKLRTRIAAMDVLATGTLQLRTKTCGREGCACMSDPDARHGPYHVWVRTRDGRLVTTTLDAAAAGLVGDAIANRREVDDLLRRWESEVEAQLLGRRPRKPRK